MGRGERVARGYIGAVLMVQALVVAALSGALDANGLALQLVSAALLWLPLVFDFQHTLQVRALSAVPAVVVAAYWASVSLPMGLVGWGAWAVITAWLCFPARWSGEVTLAQRFAPGRAQTGAHHL